MIYGSRKRTLYSFKTFNTTIICNKSYHNCEQSVKGKKIFPRDIFRQNIFRNFGVRAHFTNIFYFLSILRIQFSAHLKRDGKRQKINGAESAADRQSAAPSSTKSLKKKQEKRTREKKTQSRMRSESTEIFLTRSDSTG